MGGYLWLLWMLVGAVFVVGEMFTAGFFLLWFGVGAIAAGIMALLGLGGVWQWGVFVVVSGVLVGISRKFALKVSKEQPPGIGADRFIGKAGHVLEEIDNSKNTGLVRVGQDQWRASSETGEVIAVDTQVQVVRVDGAHLVVKVSQKGG